MSVTTFGPRVLRQRQDMAALGQTRERCASCVGADQGGTARFRFMGAIRREDREKQTIGRFGFLGEGRRCADAR